MQRPASKGHSTCRQCREPALRPATPTNTLREVAEEELFDTGFLIDNSVTPPMFVFPDGSRVPAPKDLGNFGYFLRKQGSLFGRGLLRVMKRVRS